jgi:hypothetical protein
MKPVMMAGEDTVPCEGSYRQFFDNKRTLENGLLLSVRKSSCIAMSIDMPGGPLQSRCFDDAT